MMTFSKIFSSINPEKQVVIEKLLADRAVVEDMPVEIIAEKLLLSDIATPEEGNGNIGSWLYSMYSGEGSVFSVLENCFGYIYGHPETVRDFDALLTLVKFAYRAEHDAYYPPDPEHFHCHYFKKVLRDIVEYTDSPRFPLGEHIILQDICKEVSEDFKWVSFCNLYDFVIRNWVYLKDCGDVFKLLMTMASMQPNRHSTPSQRMELANLLKVCL